MLKTGFKAGMLVDYNILNQVILTAEQMSNVNICSKILGLSDADGTDTANYFYHTQLKNILCLVSVYVSDTSLTGATYPSLSSAFDESNNNLISNYSLISNLSEEFDYVGTEKTYKVTFLKTSYSVSAGGIGKRTKYKAYPISSSAKDFDNSLLNSMFVMQISNSLTSISLLEDDTISDFTNINKIKEAFRLNMSYNLISEDVNGKTTGGANIPEHIDLINDLYEIGSLTGDIPEIARINTYNLEDVTFIHHLEKTTTSNTLFDYSVFTQNQDNQIKIGRLVPSIYSTYIGVSKGIYLTTTDTFNLAINSISQDALNSYDLVMILRDYSNRLQGKLYYPTIGNYISTVGNPNVPIDLQITFNNNIDNLKFDYELTLVNNCKLRFAIS